ncbi:MAG: hypothetical protein HC896_15140 [Bacteroidales bacterium]|nr:hypothetical protein [Bacteroidales bacterium]
MLSNTNCPSPSLDQTPVLVTPATKPSMFIIVSVMQTFRFFPAFTHGTSTMGNTMLSFSSWQMSLLVECKYSLACLAAISAAPGV